MADFEIHEENGTRFLKAILRNESIRAEAGAFAYSQGSITIDAGLPSVADLVATMLSQEALIRPTYSGTGWVALESSLGGFHILDLDNQAWICESGSYLASDAGVQLGVVRERMVTSFFGGTGLIEYQTRVSGRGKVVLTASGSVWTVDLKDDRFVTEAPIVLARSEGVRYSVRRATRTFLQSFIAGEGRTRVYEGTGRLIVSSTPYWQKLLLSKVSAAAGVSPAKADRGERCRR